MKVVFLDFDGVLNSNQWIRENGDGISGHRLIFNQHLDPAAVGRVNDIIRQTGAKVVVSSTWRRLYSLPELRDILSIHGFSGEVIGVTPTRSGPRGREIQEWLDDNAVDSLAIIDDDADMEHLSPYLVQTRAEVGLQDEDVRRCVEILEETAAPMSSTYSNWHEWVFDDYQDSLRFRGRWHLHHTSDVYTWVVEAWNEEKQTWTEHRQRLHGPEEVAALMKAWKETE